MAETFAQAPAHPLTGPRARAAWQASSSNRSCFKARLRRWRRGQQRRQLLALRFCRGAGRDFARRAAAQHPGPSRSARRRARSISHSAPPRAGRLARLPPPLSRCSAAGPLWPLRRQIRLLITSARGVGGWWRRPPRTPRSHPTSRSGASVQRLAEASSTGTARDSSSSPCPFLRADPLAGEAPERRDARGCAAGPLRIWSTVPGDAPLLHAVINRVLFFCLRFSERLPFFRRLVGRKCCAR